MSRDSCRALLVGMLACLSCFSACLWFSLAASLSICGLFSYASPSSSASQYALVYKGFSLHQDDLLYWQLPAQFTGDKVTVRTLEWRPLLISGQPFKVKEAKAPLVSSSLPTDPQSFSIQSTTWPHSLFPFKFVPALDFLSYIPSLAMLSWHM